MSLSETWCAPALREIAADDRRRNAVAARRTAARSEDHRLDPAGGVHRGTAGVAVLDLPGDSGDRPRDRPVPERVLRQDRGRPADPARRRGEPSVERIAEDRDGGSRLRVREPQRLQIDARDAEHGDVVVDVEDDDVGHRREHPAGNPDDRVLLAGDDVRRRHDRDSSRRTQPLPSTPTPHAVPRTLTTRVVAARIDGSRRTPLLGGSDGAFGPIDRRQRIDAVEQIEQRARRQSRVELLDDRRALDLVAKPGLAGREERDRRADPDDRDADRAAEEKTAGRVDRPQWRRTASRRGRTRRR